MHRNLEVGRKNKLELRRSWHPQNGWKPVSVLVPLDLEGMASCRSWTLLHDAKMHTWPGNQSLKGTPGEEGQLQALLLPHASKGIHQV
jgi:hypothetical protein